MIRDASSLVDPFGLRLAEYTPRLARGIGISELERIINDGKPVVGIASIRVPSGPSEWHAMHLGISPQGPLVSLSDGNATLRTPEGLRISAFVFDPRE